MLPIEKGVIQAHRYGHKNTVTGYHHTNILAKFPELGIMEVGDSICIPTPAEHQARDSRALAAVLMGLAQQDPEPAATARKRFQPRKDAASGGVRVWRIK